MIIKRVWRRSKYRYYRLYKYYTGWFLFGFIPLYIESTDWRY